MSLHTDNRTARARALFALLICLFVLLCSLNVIPLILIGNVAVNEASEDILKGLFAKQTGK